MSHRSQSRWNFWNRLRNEVARWRRKFGQKSHFLAIPGVSVYSAKKILIVCKWIFVKSYSVPVMKIFGNQKYQKWSFLAENQNLLRIFISQPISEISVDLRPMRYALRLFKTREKLSKFDSPYNIVQNIKKCISDIWVNGFFLKSLECI